MTILNATVFEITPTGEALGAIINRFDASQQIKPEAILHIKQALRDHHLLIFKHQSLSDDQLTNFATYFGDFYVPPSDMPVLGAKPNKPLTIVTIANAASEYEEIYLENREILPHSDNQWTPRPASGAMLYALEVPPYGGDTRWINLVKAYETLDTTTKSLIANLKLITYNPFLRKPGSVKATYRLSDSYPLDSIVFPHPLVRTHPESGKKSLNLNCAYEVEVVDMEPTAGAKLIDKLRQHINKPEFSYHHHWSVGDLIYWDNQCTLHSRQAFDKSAKRILKRICLAGSRPF